MTASQRRPASLTVSDIQRKDFLSGDLRSQGRWSSGGRRLPVKDPASGRVIAEVGTVGVADVGQAVEAARLAFDGWRQTLARERGLVLRRWAELIRRHGEDLAILCTSEQGKPLKESRWEVEYAASYLDWYAGEGERAGGEILPAHRPGSMTQIRRQPVGVAAAVTPWNCPIAMVTRKAGAALAAGCAMIVKPSPETPLSALALLRLAEEADLPDAVFQVIHGDPKALTQALLAHVDLRAFSFTGSTAIGRLLLREAGAQVKRVSLELGGHAPFIVFDDVPVETAVAGAMTAKFSTSGQDCLAANRIYVQRSIYDAFLDRFAVAIRALEVGSGLDPATDIGPMTVPSVRQKCHRHILDALRKGARLVVGSDIERDDNFVVPTLLADVTHEMLIAGEETFGPVAAVLPFDDESEVLTLANATETGLAAYLYTNDMLRVARMTERLEFGMVAVNTAGFTGPPVPFGGWKQAGLGREGGRAGIQEYLETKFIAQQVA